MEGVVTMIINRIIVEKRIDDFIAYIEGDRTIWGCGNTKNAAIGNLVSTHQDVFGIQVA